MGKKTNIKYSEAKNSTFFNIKIKYYIKYKLKWFQLIMI